jgi:hypothetical protein
MEQQRPPPGPELLQAFGERLAAFSKTGPKEEQQLLDMMLAAALRPAAGDDVETFWAQHSGNQTLPNPSWYTGGASAWNNTCWGSVWLTY